MGRGTLADRCHLPWRWSFTALLLSVARTNCWDKSAQFSWHLQMKSIWSFVNYIHPHIIFKMFIIQCTRKLRQPWDFFVSTSYGLFASPSSIWQGLLAFRDELHPSTTVTTVVRSCSYGVLWEWRIKSSLGVSLLVFFFLFVLEWFVIAFTWCILQTLLLCLKMFTGFSMAKCGTSCILKHKVEMAHARKLLLLWILSKRCVHKMSGIDILYGHHDIFQQPKAFLCFYSLFPLKKWLPR